jgi:cyclopropane fatty-acyl-phospholipid synthase-like methyltransferase
MVQEMLVVIEQSVSLPDHLAVPKHHKQESQPDLHQELLSQSSSYTKDFYELLQDGSRSSARVILPLLLELLQSQPQSVIDVGCGVATWLGVFQELGIEDCLGVDGDYVDP